MIIKLFEDFSDDQFIEINRKTFFKLVEMLTENKFLIDFTDKEKEELLKFGEINISSYIEFPDVYVDGYIYIDINMPSIFTVKVFKTNDDWYYVSCYNDTYYKCDGFEGVINCLNSIKEYHLKRYGG